MSTKAPFTSRVVMALMLCAVIAVAHQAVRWDWFIEDSAISFAYARNFVDGEGMVPFPGGERVEAYSNPTWVLLLSFFELFGISGFWSAKPMAAFFAVATMPLVYRTAYRGLSEEAKWGALLAPLVLAFNSQFAIWSASALENSLFCFLLALGVELILSEGEQENPRPYSAIVFVLLGWTRPEGLLYAAVGGVWVAWLAFRRGQLLRGAGSWFVAFWAPYAILVGLRYWYFAWPLPNTYYAKVGSHPNVTLKWNMRGWLQVREYAERLWQGWFLPIYLVGLIGLSGKKRYLALGAVVFVAAIFAVPAPGALGTQAWYPQLHLTEATWQTWFATRILLFSTAVVVLPAFSAWNSRGVARALCWHMVATTVFFAVYANGDWMGAYRWMSLLAPTSAVLFAVGVAELASFASQLLGETGLGPAGRTLAVVGALLPLQPNYNQTRAHLYFNRNETPPMVKLRADYTLNFARKTFWEGPLNNLEMDMGAHLWWRPQYREIDMAGLIDVPMARHTYKQRRFIEEYVFKENSPTFAHVHFWWATYSGFKTYKYWNNYIELPKYKDMMQLPDHDGVWARRDMVMTTHYSADELRDLRITGRVPKKTNHSVRFDKGVSLVGVDVMEGRAGQGRSFFVRTGWRMEEPGPLVVMAFLSQNGEVVAEWPLPLGYGALPPTKWRSGEIFDGKFALFVPETVPLGTYDLGFFVKTDKLELKALNASKDAVIGGEGGHVRAAGEVRFTGLIEVVPSAAPTVRAEQLKTEAVEQAHNGACKDAEVAWVRAKRTVPLFFDWHEKNQPSVYLALADCWAGQARGIAEPVELLALAHRRDHRSAVLAQVGASVGEKLYQEGLAFRAAGDPNQAYDRFSKVLRFQPWRSWARRYAEEARDARLNLAPKGH